MKRAGVIIAAALGALLLFKVFGPSNEVCPFLVPASQGPAQPAAAPGVKEDGLARTPPMGWYPWNSFGEEPQNEKLIREIVDALVSSGLKDAGYSYVGPDEGICFFRGEDGRLTTNLERYPSGLRGLGDAIHKRGLKYALYTDAGTRTCSQAMPGTKDHESGDMRQFAEWRADYIKIDWCNTEGQDIVKTYTTLHDAQLAAGRPVVHSLCSWGEGYPWRWAGEVGHLWRTTADICAPGQADWARAMRMAFANEKLAVFAGPGSWNDPDMMITGMPGISDAQGRSFFSLWCMMAAPLIAGNDLRAMSEATVKTLTNLEAIAVDQDPLGVQGRIVWTDGVVSLWAEKPLFDGSRAVLVFNQGRHEVKKPIAWPEVGLDGATACYVRNLWTHETAGPLTGGVTVSVAPDDIAFLRVSPRNDFPLPPILVADSYLLSFRSAGSGPQKLSATVTVADRGSFELPLWRVGHGLPAWLSVSVLKNGKSQVFRSTVSTSGLKKGLYHAAVRADNTEPVSGRPMSALYFDVDLEVTQDVSGRSK
jgi:alpha-galactosidase